MDRSLPSIEYLQFEDHPALIVVYTPRLRQHRKYNTLKLKLIKVKQYGRQAHTTSAITRLNTGDK